MKNIFSYIAISLFSVTGIAQQVVLDFEKNNGYTYDYVHNSKKKIVTATIVDNPVKDEINNSDKVMEYNYVAGADAWDYVGFSSLGGETGFNINSTQGKFFKIKFLSKTASNFTLTIRLWHAEDTKIDIVKEFKNVTLNKWHEAEFDFSEQQDIYITRIDPWFQDGSKPDGDVYLIDELFQRVTSSLPVVVEAKPEPVKAKAKSTYRRRKK